MDNVSSDQISAFVRRDELEKELAELNRKIRPFEERRADILREILDLNASYENGKI